MRKHIRLWCIATALAALVTGTAAAQPSVIELDEAEIFIEINATDGDAGIQVMLDAEGWDQMVVRDPDGKKVLEVKASGSIGFQGITELFLESAEPSFDEQPLAEFLALFPEGTYELRGRTIDNVFLVGEAELTHALPAAPVLVAPVPGDEDVDPDDTVIQWQLVPDPPGSSIVGYQVIVEREEPTLLVFSADLGPTATEVTVPPEFMLPDTEYKYEVLAIEESGNKTISEAEFATAEEE